MLHLHNPNACKGLQASYTFSLDFNFDESLFLLWRESLRCWWTSKTFRTKTFFELERFYSFFPAFSFKFSSLHPFQLFSGLARSLLLSEVLFGSFSSCFRNTWWHLYRRYSRYWFRLEVVPRIVTPHQGLLGGWSLAFWGCWGHGWDWQGDLHFFCFLKSFFQWHPRNSHFPPSFWQFGWWLPRLRCFFRCKMLLAYIFIVLIGVY